VKGREKGEEKKEKKRGKEKHACREGRGKNSLWK